MTRDEANQIVRASVSLLRRDDTILLENDVSECAITHQLAIYLQSQLPALRLEQRLGLPRICVDCEYNRNREDGVGAPKTLHIVEDAMREVLEAGNLDEDERRTVTTRPDIIIHYRGLNAHNLLVIEVKKTTNRTPRALDFQKLQAFTEPPGPNRYHYRHGLFLELGAGPHFLREPELRWFCNGIDER